MTTIFIKQDTVLPARHENDLYRTERNLIRAALPMAEDHPNWAPLNDAIDLLDVGAGDGRWGAIFSEAYECRSVVGVEIMGQPKPEGFTHWYPNQDFMTWNTPDMFDLVVSNPPYYIAEKCIRKSWSLLRPNGVMIFLLRLAFMEGVDRYKGMWAELPPAKVGVLSRRPSFYGNGTNGTAYSIFCWYKSSSGMPIGEARKWPVELVMYDRDPKEE